MPSRRNYLKYTPFQSEFSRLFACWSVNHNGWRKMKRQNRRYAKLVERRLAKKEMQHELEYISDEEYQGACEQHDN